jgi:methylisocitrate lyase
MTTLNDVLDEVQRITAACDLPLLVDADTGWGSPLNISRTFKMLSRLGAAGAHIEDQQEFKRCGHREGKHLVSTQQMVGRLKAALDGREHDSFVVMARTDALQSEGLQGALDRALEYQNAGADAIFVEALTSLEQFATFCDALEVPVLANITEFGKTPLFTKDELAQAGIDIVLYPLSAFRAMNKAAVQIYQTIRQQGTQQSMIESMQNRQELYHYLNYEQYEQRLEHYLHIWEDPNGSH